MDYVSEKDPGAAINLDEKVDKIVERLSQFPGSARIGRLPVTREAITGPYVLVYEIYSGAIIITHFVHGTQMFPDK